jgi:predicted lipoprotein with Yx(FWY)xxD motif
MRRFAASDLRLPPIRLVPLAAVVGGLLGPGLAQAAPTQAVAKQAANPTLGRTVLTTLKGRSLYSLSVETNGRFVCTGTCLSTWHPLVVPAGARPTGPVRLSTIERPDGRSQVTYRGRPLYRFGGDAKPGDVNGEGFKDVGTWHAAVTARDVPSPQPQPQPQPQPESPYPY